MSLVQGTLNKPCLGIPIQADVQNIVALVNVGVQDILNDTQDQQCVENSTAVKGDSALSHILENVLSENASAAVRVLTSRRRSAWAGPRIPTRGAGARPCPRPGAPAAAPGRTAESGVKHFPGATASVR